MRSLVLASLFFAVGCSGVTATENTGSAEAEQITDVVSMTQRPDGRFDVVCRGINGGPNRPEIVSASQIQTNQVCVPPPPPPPPPPGSGRILQGSDRTIELGHSRNNFEVEQWGRGLWEGFISFDGKLIGAASMTWDDAHLVDGTGAKYPLSLHPTRYERLPLPVRLVATTDGTVMTRASFTQVTFEVTRTNPIPAQGMTGNYSSGTSAAQQLRVIGTDIPGAKMSLSVQSRFFNNFTNGNACSRIALTDRAGQTVSLAPSDASRSVDLTAPVAFHSLQTCISSRLATPESTIDFEVSVSSITLGDPQ